MNKKFISERMVATRNGLSNIEGLLGTIKNEASNLLFLNATAKLSDNLKEELGDLLSSYSKLEKARNELYIVLHEVEDKLELDDAESYDR